MFRSSWDWNQPTIRISSHRQLAPGLVRWRDVFKWYSMQPSMDSIKIKIQGNLYIYRYMYQYKIYIYICVNIYIYAKVHSRWVTWRVSMMAESLSLDLRWSVHPSEMGPQTQLFGFSLLELFPPKWIYYLILIHIHTYIYIHSIYIDYISYIPPKDRWGNNFHHPFWGEIMLGPLLSCKVPHRSCQGVLGRLGFARRPGTIREAASDNDLV